RKGLLVSSRILDGHFNSHVAPIDERIALDSVKLFCMRMALVVEPEFVVESDRIHHQRVVFPMSYGMAVPRRIGIGRMFSVHKNLPVTMDVALIQDEVMRWALHDSPRIR